MKVEILRTVNSKTKAKTLKLPVHCAKTGLSTNSHKTIIRVYKTT